MKGYIYKIINLITGDCYVGQTVSLQRRKSRHFCMLRDNKHHSPHLQNSYNKYGKSNIEFIIIEEYIFSENISKDYIKEYMACREIFYISKINPVFNVDKVIKDSSLGRKLTEEHRNKISKALKGRMPSEATLEGSRKYHTGRKFTEEELIRHRSVKRGRPKTQEEKDIIKEERRKFYEKSFYVWNLEGHFIGEFKNQSEAAEKLGLNHDGTISRCLSKKLYKSTQGYVFSYVGEYSKNLELENEKERWLEEFVDKQDRGIYVIVFDKNGNMIAEFKSLKEAGDYLGLCSTGISECLSGRKTSVKGFTFKRKEETNG